MSVTLCQVAGAHPAHIKAYSMVLVTHRGKEEKPGGLRDTDALVRRRWIWRATEYWGGVGGVSRFTRQPRSPTPLFFCYRKHSRPRREWLRLPDIHSQEAQENP